MMKEEPITPSKKGTKRKSEKQTGLFGQPATKAPAKKAAPKKATAGKSRAKKEVKKEAPGINAVFKATKNSARPAGKPSAKVTESSSTTTKLEDTKQPQAVPKENVIDTIHVKKRPATPRKQKLTAIKPTFRRPLSDTDPQNNHSPTHKRPEVECFTPVKHRTPSEQLRQETVEHGFGVSTSDDSRPSTANSQRYETTIPLSVPNGMSNLLTTATDS
jgi:NAD-dependent histone deacetylase SIR2